MAQSVGPNAEYVQVFEASFPGIHVFSWDTHSSASLCVNGDSENTFLNGMAIYLNSGDTVSHKGPAIQLSGVRLGDEL